MALTSIDDRTFIQNEIDRVVQGQSLHGEYSMALGFLNQESQERVAVILRKKAGNVSMLDLEELLEPV